MELTIKHNKKNKHKEMEIDNVKKTRKRNKNISSSNFNIYIQKILQKNTETFTMTKESKNTLNSLIFYLANRMEKILLIVKKYSVNKTISDKDFMSVLYLLYDRNDVSNAVHGFCDKAVISYKDYNLQRQEQKDINEENDQLTPTQQNIKAGLVISVPRVQRIFMKNHSRISSVSMVYFTAILEYFVTDLLVLTTEYITSIDKSRIKPIHINHVINQHSVYKKIFKNVFYFL